LLSYIHFHVCIVVGNVFDMQLLGVLEELLLVCAVDGLNVDRQLVKAAVQLRWKLEV
jgi:hypothetical protein